MTDWPGNHSNGALMKNVPIRTGFGGGLISAAPGGLFSTYAAVDIFVVVRLQLPPPWSISHPQRSYPAKYAGTDHLLVPLLE